MIDLHNDFLDELNTKADVGRYLKSTKSAFICCAVWSTNRTLQQIKEKKKLLPKNKKYKFCIEDIGNLGIADVLKLKPYYISLTWNNKNKYAGGALSSGGLTKLGKQAIAEFEKYDIIIDVAHLNRKSFWQFARLTTKPIFCSHACCNALCTHPRNLTNQQLKATNTLGITLVKDFLGNHSVQSHINFAKKHVKHVFIGSDFFGSSNLMLNHYEQLLSKLSL